MKVVATGKTYRIFQDDLKTYEQLPPKVYRVEFNEMEGYSLAEISEFEDKETKVYGEHDAKIEKILNSFDKMPRSLGVLLSGDKGIGKSLFTQMLAQAVNERNMPVILITRRTPSLSDFLMEIEQEVMFLFDEFEKIFDREDQEKMLGLFDGLNTNKHLFALTVNNLNQVTEFMINRTGRVHYHIRFQYPTIEEVREYLLDKVDFKYQPEIEQVVRLAARMPLNYDLLRAIAFELNLGLSLQDALSDLNITQPSNKVQSTVVVKMKKDTVPNLVFNASADLMSETIELYGHGAGYTLNLEDLPQDNVSFQDNKLVLHSLENVITSRDLLVYSSTDLRGEEAQEFYDKFIDTEYSQQLERFTNWDRIDDTVLRSIDRPVYSIFVDSIEIETFNQPNQLLY